MSIASAITTAQQRVANAYTSVSTMGGTLPATQNLNNLPTAIESIPAGGGSKYGCTIDNLLGSVNASGVLQLPANTEGNIVFTGVLDVAQYGLAYRFYQNTNLTHGVSFPDLTTISGNYGCYSMFYLCLKLTSANLPALTTISGDSGCYSMFSYCTGITSVNLPALTTISGTSGCYQMFRYCTKLSSIDFASLTNVTGSQACGSMFQQCTEIKNIYFRALTTASFGSTYINQFNNMMVSTGSTTTHTIHFPSNLESTIQGLTGYPLFGGTSGYVVLAYDLPATS